MMGLANRRLRYGYYLACFGGLELLHLLINQPPTLISLFTPLTALIALSGVSLLVRTRHDLENARFASIARQQREYFLHELFVYVVVALLSLIVSREVFGLTFYDSLYDSVFILLLGYFASIEKTLEASATWYRLGAQQRADTFRLIPIIITLQRATYSVLAAMLILLTAAIFRYYTAIEETRNSVSALISFGLELGFFMLMIGYLMLRIARRYTTNMHYILETQFKVVRDAQAGDYSQTIPLLSQGELGLMSMQINRLIEYVRQREDVENLLKRVVSPDVMEKLITTDSDKLKRGEEREVAILFCDIRGFTEMSEGAAAADVIFFLNSFFAELTEIVARHHGTINKFMGDAILAVYGSDDPNEAIDAAMNTANEITMRVRQMRLPNGGSPETGTGIHFGRVVAGTIGSDQRYEYTYLGDAVNTASRLQGLSKRLGYPIIVSSDAYDLMSGYIKLGLTDLGQHMVRGKSEALHIYGGPNSDEYIPTE